jgi:hypothetical protein
MQKESKKDFYERQREVGSLRSQEIKKSLFFDSQENFWFSVTKNEEKEDNRDPRPAGEKKREERLL